MTTRERIGLAGVLGVALVLRILLVVSLEGTPYFDTPVVDSAAYDQWAWDISHGHFWGDRAFYQDPLYPYGLAGFYKLFGRNFFWVRIAQAALATAGLAMFFLAVRRFLGYRTAMGATVLGALYRPYLFYDTALLKEFLGVVAIEAALWAWSCTLAVPARASNAAPSGPPPPVPPAPGLVPWLGLGAALGLGALVRGNLLLVAAAVAGLLLFQKRWKPAGGLLAGALLAIAPVTIRNAAVSGDFVLTTCQLGPNLYTGNNPDNRTGRYLPPPFLTAGAPEFEESGFRAEAERLSQRRLKASEVDAFWRGRAVDYILSNPGTFAAVTAKRALLLTNAFEVPDNYNLPFMARFSWVLRAPLLSFGWIVAPLAAAGLYLSWPDRKKFGFLYLFLGTYVLSILFFFVFDRYRLPVLPILMIFAAHGVVRLLQLRDWQMKAVPRTAAAVFAAALIGVNLPLPASISGPRDFRTAHRNLGLYYLTHDRPALAAEEFEAAARLNPAMMKDPTFVWKLGESFEKSGQTPRALETYRIALGIDRESHQAPYRVGLLYFNEGMYDRAAEMLTEALRRDPGFAPAAEPLAESYRRLRRFDAALDALTGPAQRDPRNWKLRLKRAQIYRELSMWKETLQAAEEVLAQFPGQPDAAALRDEARKKLRWPF